MEPLRELEFLQRLSLTAAQTLDPAKLLELVIGETTGALDVDVCSVYLLDTEDGRLVLTATNGLSQAGVGHVRMAVGEGITGWAAQERRPVSVPDVREERRFRWMPGIDQARFVSMCSVPILSDDRLVGVINVQTDERHHFAMGEIDMLVAIAAQVAGVLERAGLQRRLEERVAELRRSEDIHRRFTELSLTGAGLESICREIASQAGSAVALYDDEGGLLTSSAADLMPECLATDELVDSDALFPVRAGAVALGWLMVAAADPSPSRARAIEHGVTVIALELSRERAAIETEHRLRGDLVEELLAAQLTPADVARLVDRAARLGMRLRRRMWVAMIEPDDDDADRAMRDPNRSRRLVRALTATASGRHTGAMVVERGGAFVMLLPDPAASTHVERTGELALATLAEVVVEGSFSCGISGASGDPAELFLLAEQAKLALHVGRRSRSSGAVSSYRRLGAERILAAASGEADLERYVDEWLGPLVRQESQGRAAAPLIETIQALTDVSWSLRAAARKLNIHVNTLLYRLQRAREISGRDLDDPDVRLALALALRARTMVGVSETVVSEPAPSARAAE